MPFTRNNNKTRNGLRKSYDKKRKTHIKEIKDDNAKESFSKCILYKRITVSRMVEYSIYQIIMFPRRL